tara:strand:+ start:4417 stop:5004 length:588 start_codon:yes stop_codon:yes gene_type:complete
MDKYIIINISYYLKNYNDIKNLSLCNKSTTEIKNLYNKYLLIKNKYFNYLKKYKILKYLQEGPFKRFANKYPILNWESNFLGYTGYIDNISLHNLSYPIMIGIDSYKRPFISIKFIRNRKSGCVTYFQRYENCKYNWVWGGSCFYNYGNNRLNYADVPKILYLLDEMENNDEVHIHHSVFKLNKIAYKLQKIETF